MIYPHPLPYSNVRGRKPSSDIAPASGSSGIRLRWKKALAWTALVALSTACLVILAFTVTIIKLRPTLPTAMQIATYQPPVGTNIYSSDGVLLATLQLENRKVVPLSKISPDLIAATLAVEDSRFYQHGAVDPKGLARAAWANLTSGNTVGQGGSTISMQLARNVPVFGLSREKRLSRKLREVMTAVRIEQVFSKDEVLELYLNQIYYGGGAYGVEAASRTYFGKPASTLSLAEAALLAGLPRRPEYYSPVVSREHARERRDVVLARMLQTGKIDRARYDNALSEPLKIRRLNPTTTVYKAPYFVDWIVQDLVRKYGVDTVYGGMKIVTTLDWRMQEAAERAVRRGLTHGATQGALVSIDPHSGEVRAMVGGADYHKDRFNAITQGKRQPGSAFKPLVYAAAFDSGTVMLNDEVTDDPISAKSGREMWTVHNYSGNYTRKSITVKHAITQSINTVAVKVAAGTGIPQVIRYAEAMGITTPLAPYLSLALGSSAVRPIDLTSAYGHFAAEGPRFEPTGIRSIRSREGRDLAIPSAYRRRKEAPIQASTIQEINEALRSVVTEGTGYAASAVPNAFGKTGTTSDHRDAWFVGYTPELVTTVWVAAPYRNGHGVLRYRPMPGGTGGHVAVPIWSRFMLAAVPVQRRANQLRHVGPFTIQLPAREELEKPDDSVDVRVVEKTEPDAQDIDRWLADARRADRSDSNGGYWPGAMREDRRGRVTVFHPSDDSRKSWSRNGRDDGDSVQYLAVTDRRGVVQVCADSGLLATQWCPATFGEDPTTGVVPRSYCRLHHAPAGEQ